MTVLSIQANENVGTEASKRP